MGYFSETMFGYECDGCKEIFYDYYEHNVFPDKISLVDRMNDSEWEKINGKWYCPDCVKKLFDQDEDTGEYHLKQKGK